MTLRNKICKNSCCASCFVCEYPGKLIEMQMGNASIPLSRRNWVFFAQQLVLWGQSSGYICGSLHCNVQKLFYCLVIDCFLLSGLPLASETSVFWGLSPSHSSWVVCFINCFHDLHIFLSVKYIYSAFGLIAFGSDSEWYVTQQDGCIIGHLYKELMFVSLVSQLTMGSYSKPIVAFGCFFQNAFMHTISDILLVKKKGEMKKSNSYWQKPRTFSLKSHFSLGA